MHILFNQISVVQTYRELDKQPWLKNKALISRWQEMRLGHEIMKSAKLQEIG